MNVIERVLSDYQGWQKKWDKNFLPPDLGFMPPGFETADERDDEDVVKSFQTLMLLIGTADKVKLIAQISDSLTGNFIYCLRQIKGQNYHVSAHDYLVAENKQSMSIVIEIATKDRRDLRKLYTPFKNRESKGWVPLGEAHDGMQNYVYRWRINNTLFGWFLLAVGYDLGENWK